jgi:eukaryotic-like serine/threonine-protein kinase
MTKHQVLLRAVIFADMVGYTRWLETDQVYAMKLVAEARKVIAAEAEEYGGIVHRQFGDGFLVTFASTVDAVRCALATQDKLSGGNPPALRIGIDMGDVVMSGDDIHAPAVNVAARLQSLEPYAAPGTVVVSENVWRQIRNQVEFEIEHVGREFLKNVTEPAEIFVVKFRPSYDLGDSPQMQPGSSLLHYRIQKKIGEGGMGEVFLADDTRLKRKVAIKVLPSMLRDNPKMVNRLRKEAEAAAQLNHPNIATIYSVEENQGLVFIVMEYIDGDTLGNLIPPGGLELERFYEWYIPLADGLSHAHQNGIIHRDIKPSNIMVSREENTPKILDFGLATILASPQRASSSLEPQESSLESGIERGDAHSTTASSRDVDVQRNDATPSDLGSWENMSPEQVTGQPVDHRSDIYSFGVTMYRGLTGVQPFQGVDEESLIDRILNFQPVPLRRIRPETPRRLRKVTEKTLAKESVYRYRDTATFVRDLRKAGRRNTGREVLSMIGAVVLILSAYWIYTTFGGGKPPPVTVVDTGLSVAPRVAIFPVKSTDDEHRDMPVGSLHIEVRNKLTRLKGLRVVSDMSVNSALSRLGNTASPIALLRDLRVDYMLRGQTVAHEKGLRINVELIDTLGLDIWSKEWIVSSEEIATVPSAMASQLLASLNVQVSRDDSLAIYQVGTDNLFAYRQYLDGLMYVKDRTPVSNGLAVAAFESAIDLDPQYAEPHARLAEALRVRMSLDPRRENEETLELPARRRSTVDLALQLDPRSAVAHLELGYLLFNSNPDSARGEFEQVVVLTPGAVEGLAAQRSLYYQTKDYTNALVWADRVIEMEPNLYQHYHMAALIQTALGRYRNALDTFGVMADLRAELTVPYVESGRIHMKYYRNYDEAEEWFLRAKELGDSRFVGEVKSDLSSLYIRTDSPGRIWALYPDDDYFGFPFRAFAASPDLRQVDRLITLIEEEIESGSESNSAWYSLGLSYERNGDLERASACYDTSIAILQRSVDSIDAGSFQAGSANLYLAMSLAKKGRLLEATEKVQVGLLFEHHSSRYLAALAYAELGESVKATRLLRSAIEERPFWVDLAKRDLGFSDIRFDPDFAALLGEFN